MAVVPALADEITSHVNRALPQQVFQPTVNQIVGAVTPHLAWKLTDSVEKYSKKAFPPEVMRRLVPSLTSTLSQTLLRRIDTEFSYEASSQLAQQIGQTLCKSLTQTLVGGLAHSMTRNPLNDYYCYYCSKDKLYCEYCSSSPSQSYFASYYAGYYSTYLCGYFAEFESKRLDRELQLERQRIDEEEREMAQFQVLFDESAQETTSDSQPKREREIFDTKFDPLYDGWKVEVSDPNAIPTLVFDPDQYVL
eukprot:jgi/Bigna1/67062/fgenesh1_pg.3_\